MTLDLDLDIAPAVRVHADADALGRAAASDAATRLRAALDTQPTARLMLAAAPSQEATLRWLIREPGIDWARVDAFHMDDYIGLPASAPQGFGNWLVSRFVEPLDGAPTFHRIDTTNDPQDEARRYGDTMGHDPFDLVLLGLGVNGHLAFNDPPADFHGADGARVVPLDVVSRQQQVDEGHFPDLAAVPAQAITVTIPRLLDARHLVASVPGGAKRQAVRDSLRQSIGGRHPGTALRTHPSVVLHVDEASHPSADR
ncbi:6-phosphogluconolactonase [Frigoribacterium sp. 2-23]|uniref:6-phosphogluconolactonase n=1 Tax=Frigoribacterium sp. 2-23 TaxID=3415006 RepID=UPI003C6EC9FB